MKDSQAPHKTKSFVSMKDSQAPQKMKSSVSKKDPQKMKSSVSMKDSMKSSITAKDSQAPYLMKKALTVSQALNIQDMNLSERSEINLNIVETKTEHEPERMILNSPRTIEMRKDGTKVSKGDEFFQHCMRGDQAEVTKILHKDPSLVRHVNVFGENALHWVVTKKANKRFIEFLLKKGVDINQATPWGRTPLHFACFSNQSENALVLIENGADVDLKNNLGKTPLEFWLDMKHHPKVIEKAVEISRGKFEKKISDAEALIKEAQDYKREELLKKYQRKFLGG